MRFLKVALWCMGGVVAATASTAQGVPATGAPYRVGARDLLEISVFEVPEVNGEYRVEEDGSIRLPLIETISLAGLTKEEAESRISRELVARYVNTASVEVQFRELRSKPITVMGAVKQPGALKFSGRWTLFDAITEAGGLAEGHDNTIYILRRAETGLTDQIAISVNDLLVKLDPRANVPLQPNDVINIPATVKVTIYCLGQVATTGPISFTSNERITVLAAIARAGGLSDRASKKILVKRRGPDGLNEEIRVNYKAVLSGAEPDIELQEGDILVVPEAFF